MVLMKVKALIVFSPPAPAALVLSPETNREGEEIPGIYRVVPIWVGSPEAMSLKMALEGKRANRPITHELFTEVLTVLDARVEQVVIDEVEGKLFSAKLFLKQYDRELVIDSRPSDAIALALRQNAPIYMLDDVLEQASFPYIVRNTMFEEEMIASFHDFLETVAPDDFKG